jgi:hypothetical protein
LGVAPEKKQTYGERSKQHLARLVFNKEVRIDWHKRDKYGRTIGKVWVAPTDCSNCSPTVDASLYLLLFVVRLACCEEHAVAARFAICNQFSTNS